MSQGIRQIIGTPPNPRKKDWGFGGSPFKRDGEETYPSGSPPGHFIPRPLPQAELAFGQSLTTQQIWDQKNAKGQCGKCDHPFTEQNPNAGGGMCQHCWAQSH